MSEDILAKGTNTDLQWYSDNIPLRGCQFNLQQIKAAYLELSALTKSEGEKIVDQLEKPKGMRKATFADRNEMLKDDAFRLTVSIVGFDGQTAYGETEKIFDSGNLPNPIKTIYFTNETSFRRHANDTLPSNRFSLWLHFYKPPLFDPNPGPSEPTPNNSGIEIRADDVGYFRAVQTIASKKLDSSRKWYSFIHQKFAYDVGLWFIGIPCALYWVTTYAEHLFPTDSDLASFRVAFFIYGLGISLLVYRSLFGYIKWAFPVNILEENSDTATRHRVILAAIVFSLVVSSIRSVWSDVTGL